MNFKIKALIWLLPVLILTACDYDNYDSPQSKFEGNIVYQGENINVGYQNVSFQLYQAGFGKETPIDVTVDQDGSFSALLFDGDYRLVFPQGQGPFVMRTNADTNSDTVKVSISGGKQLDVEVTPYYLVENPDFSISSGTVTASCSLKQIITGNDAKNIDHVNLYISKTDFVDGRTSVASQNINGADITDMNSITLSADVPELTPIQDYVFARIGVKISGVDDMIFSPIMKLQLN